MHHEEISKLIQKHAAPPQPAVPSPTAVPDTGEPAMNSPAPLPSAIRQAAMQGEVQTVVDWLISGGLVDAAYLESTTKGLENVTLLHSAASANQPKMVRMLLMRGASVDLQTTQGVTALMWALWQDGNGHLPSRRMRDAGACVKLLLRAGANPELQSKNGQTALRYAEANSHENIVKLIRQYTVKSQPALPSPAGPPDTGEPAVSSPETEAEVAEAAQIAAEAEAEVEAEAEAKATAESELDAAEVLALWVEAVEAEKTRLAAEANTKTVAAQQVGAAAKQAFGPRAKTIRKRSDMLADLEVKAVAEAKAEAEAEAEAAEVTRLAAEVEAAEAETRLKVEDYWRWKAEQDGQAGQTGQTGQAGQAGQAEPEGFVDELCYAIRDGQIIDATLVDFADAHDQLSWNAMRRQGPILVCCGVCHVWPDSELPPASL